jgi:hypothetical protein
MNKKLILFADAVGRTFSFPFYITETGAVRQSFQQLCASTDSCTGQGISHKSSFLRCSHALTGFEEYVFNGWFDICVPASDDEEENNNRWK